MADQNPRTVNEAGVYTARGAMELHQQVAALAEQGFRIIAVIDTQNGDYQVVAQKEAEQDRSAAQGAKRSPSRQLVFHGGSPLVIFWIGWAFFIFSVWAPLISEHYFPSGARGEAYTGAISVMVFAIGREFFRRTGKSGGDHG